MLTRVVQARGCLLHRAGALLYFRKRDRPPTRHDRAHHFRSWLAGSNSPRGFPGGGMAEVSWATSLAHFDAKGTGPTRTSDRSRSSAAFAHCGQTTFHSCCLPACSGRHAIEACESLKCACSRNYGSSGTLPNHKSFRNMSS